jgi:hypothetical protein
VPVLSPAGRRAASVRIPNLTLDLMRGLKVQRTEGAQAISVAQPNEGLPFMVGDAQVSPDVIDYFIGNRQRDNTLFEPPRLSMACTHGSALMRDSGELQIGTGALGDALVYDGPLLRDQQPARYTEVFDHLHIRENSAANSRATANSDRGLDAIGTIEARSA